MVVTASLLAGRPILLSAAGLTIVFALKRMAFGCRLARLGRLADQARLEGSAGATAPAPR